MNDPHGEATRALRALSVPDDVAQRHLARLAAASVTGEAATVVPMRARRHVLRATSAGLVLAATLGAGAGVAAASTAQPGDTLYGLKTARERLQLSMSRPGDSRARLELKLARTRLGEAAALLRAGDAARAIETLARADAALAAAGAQGGDDVDTEVAGELDRRVEVLGGLLSGGLPDTAADAAREALDRALERGGRPAPGTTPGKSGEAPGRENKPAPLPTPTSVPSEPPGSPDPSERPGPDNHPTGRPSSPPGLSIRP